MSTVTFSRLETCLKLFQRTVAVSDYLVESLDAFAERSLIGLS